MNVLDSKLATELVKNRIFLKLITVEESVILMILIVIMIIIMIMIMITDRIGRQEDLLPINHKNYNFREKKNNQVIKKGKFELKCL